MNHQIRTIFIKLLITICLSSFTHLSFSNTSLNGLAVHNELSQEQFIAALYLNEKTDSARQVLLNNGVKSIEIRITADRIYPRRFRQMWVEGIAINSAAKELEKYAESLSQFTKLLKVRLRKGDILRINKKNSGVSVLINGQELGRIDDPSFFDLLLRSWVGPVPLSSEFKDDILSAGNIDNDLLTRFQNVEPTEDRTRAIIAALAAEKDKKEPKPEPEPEPEVAQAQPENPEPKDEPKPSKPKVVQTTPQPKPPAPSVVPPTPKPKDTAKELAVVDKGLISEDDLFDDESILEDDDEDTGFSAEELLSQQLYFSKLTRWTANFVEYPRKAVKRNQEGTVRIRVELKRNGRVLNVDFTERSEHSDLNKAAERAVRNASPYPAIPDEISDDNLVFTIPVVFRLR